VLLTHLHVDHVGWNTLWRDGRWAPVFPNARYVFSQPEFDFFATPAGEPRRMVFEDSVRPIVEAGLSQMVPEAGAEIAAGIRFLPTPGHSIGHMAIAIESQDEMALFSGDVMHSPLQVLRPAWNSVFCLDQSLARTSRQWLLAYAVETGAAIFPAHFQETSAGMVQRRSEGAYEWSWRDAVSSE